MIGKILIVGLASLWTITAFAENLSAAHVSKSQYGSNWPYPTASSGEVACTTISPGRYAVTIKLGKTVFGLNGTAREQGYPDSRSQMLRDRESGVYRLGATDRLIKLGLQLCPSG